VDQLGGLQRGPPDAGIFRYGGVGWLPVVGDWNGDGATTVGVLDPSSATWYLRNENSAGIADVATPFRYGLPGWKPVAGDWNADGRTGISVLDPAGMIVAGHSINDVRKALRMQNRDVHRALRKAVRMLQS
jgi:hypothetical protein